jgi:hypothetical protein
MKMNTKTMMKCVGTTLAICSALTMLEGTKMKSNTAKNAVKKTANKIVDIVDTVSTFM